MGLRRTYYAIIAVAWLAFIAGVVATAGQTFGQEQSGSAGTPAPQSGAPTGAPSAGPALGPQEFTLTVNPDDLSVINQGLQGVVPPPFGKVAPLLQKLQGQIIKQQAGPPSAGGSVGAPQVTPPPVQK